MEQQDKELLKKFGKHIKELRLKTNTSLTDFSFKKGGLTSASLSRIENGLVDFKFTSLLKFAKALDMSIPELFKDFDFNYELTDE